MRTRTVCLALLLMAGGACRSGSTPSAPAASSWQAARDAAGPVYEALAAMAANFPDLDTLTPKACDPPPKWMGSMSWNELARAAGKEPSAVEKEVGTIAAVADVGRIHRLPGRDETPQYPSATTYTEATEEFAQRSHLAVLRLRAAKAGEVAGRTFDAGYIEGWLVVFDTKTRQPVCQWPVSARSSAKVSYTVRVGAGAADEQGAKREAVERDLKDKLRSALSEATRQLTGK